MESSMRGAVAKSSAKYLMNDTKKKMTKTFDTVANDAKHTQDYLKGSKKSKNAPSKKIKGRPSVMKQESKLEVIEKYAPEYRSIELWNRKLENMLTILQADDLISKSIICNKHLC